MDASGKFRRERNRITALRITPLLRKMPVKAA